MIYTIKNKCVYIYHEQRIVYHRLMVCFSGFFSPILFTVPKHYPVKCSIVGEYCSTLYRRPITCYTIHWTIKLQGEHNYKQRYSYIYIIL